MLLQSVTLTVKTVVMCPRGLLIYTFTSLLKYVVFRPG